MPRPQLYLETGKNGKQRLVSDDVVKREAVQFEKDVARLLQVCVHIAGTRAYKRITESVISRKGGDRGHVTIVFERAARKVAKHLGLTLNFPDWEEK